MINVIFQGYYTYTKCPFFGWVVDTNDNIENPKWEPLDVFDRPTLSQMLQHLSPVQRTQVDLVNRLNNLLDELVNPHVVRKATPPSPPKQERPLPFIRTKETDKVVFKPFIVSIKDFMRFTVNTDREDFLQLREQILNGQPVDLQPVSKYF